MGLRLNGSTSGYVELNAPAVAGNTSITVPTGGFGKILQVVQAVKTDTATVNTTTWTTPSGLSVSITPSASSSKILVLCDVKFQGSTGATTAQGRIIRGSTAIYIGDASGSRPRAMVQNYWNAEAYHSPTSGGVFLDSPATTSAITYSFQCKSENTNTTWINRTQGDRNSTADARTASSITVMEVAA